MCVFFLFIVNHKTVVYLVWNENTGLLIAHDEKFKFCGILKDKCMEKIDLFWGKFRWKRSVQNGWFCCNFLGKILLESIWFCTDLSNGSTFPWVAGNWWWVIISRWRVIVSKWWVVSVSFVCCTLHLYVIVFDLHVSAWKVLNNEYC